MNRRLLVRCGAPQGVALDVATVCRRWATMLPGKIATEHVDGRCLVLWLLPMKISPISTASRRLYKPLNNPSARRCQHLCLRNALCKRCLRTIHTKVGAG